MIRIQQLGNVVLQVSDLERSGERPLPEARA
jgi:hypothetical protein